MFIRYIIIKARDYYYLTYNTIQKDVLLYGPTEASFRVYDDFLNYKSGKRLSTILYTTRFYFYYIYFLLIF